MLYIYIPLIIGRWVGPGAGRRRRGVRLPSAHTGKGGEGIISRKITLGPETSVFDSNLQGPFQNSREYWPKKLKN